MIKESQSGQKPDEPVMSSERNMVRESVEQRPPGEPNIEDNIFIRDQGQERQQRIQFLCHHITPRALKKASSENLKCLLNQVQHYSCTEISFQIVVEHIKYFSVFKMAIEMNFFQRTNLSYNDIKKLNEDLRDINKITHYLQQDDLKALQMSIKALKEEATRRFECCGYIISIIGVLFSIAIGVSSFVWTVQTSLIEDTSKIWVSSVVGIFGLLLFIFTLVIACSRHSCC